jgi:hypothetical protein
VSDQSDDPITFRLLGRGVIGIKSRSKGFMHWCGPGRLSEVGAWLVYTDNAGKRDFYPQADVEHFVIDQDRAWDTTPKYDPV